MAHEIVICPHGVVQRRCRCIKPHATKVEPCPTPDLHAGRPVTAGWTHDGSTEILAPTAAEQSMLALQNRVNENLQAIQDAADQGLKLRPGDQPLPVVNDSPDVQSQVIADIEERRQLGISRYGTALQPHNGRDALRDAYEEAIDLAMYLKQAILERDNMPQRFMLGMPEQGCTCRLIPSKVPGVVHWDHCALAPQSELEDEDDAYRV